MLFFKSVLCFLHPRIQTKNLFDTKQTIYLIRGLSENVDNAGRPLTFMPIISAISTLGQDKVISCNNPVNEGSVRQSIWGSGVPIEREYSIKQSL